METSILSPTQKYTASSLFALAIHQSQLQDGDSVLYPDDHQPWLFKISSLITPVLRFLALDSQACHGLLETASSPTQARNHIRTFLTSLSQENDATSDERMDLELALSKAVDAMEMTLETTPDSFDDSARSDTYQHKCREKHTNSNADLNSCSHGTSAPHITAHKIHTIEDAPSESSSRIVESPMKEGTFLSYQRKVTILYELLSACLVKSFQGDRKKIPIEIAYDARHRVALRLLTTWLDIQWKKMEALEILVATSLMESMTTESPKKEGDVARESYLDEWQHAGIIGAAALAGGTLMAATGGLVAPAIAGGFSALGLSAAAGSIGSATGSTAFAASFGAAGAGLTGKKMARRVGGIEDFVLKRVGKNHNQGRLAAAILISGLIFEDDDFVRPWEGHNDNLERYALQWESKHLIAVSTAIQSWLSSSFSIELMKQGAIWTAMSTILPALSLPSSLLTITNIIDSNWAIALDRSDKGGKLLADVLVQRLHGNRPVTLIGYSLGARLIFKCLQCLAETGFDGAELIERVVLLGAPVSIKNENWDSSRKMVAGRFVNAYSTNDWILGIAFRASLLSQGLAGIQSVDVPGIENVDVTPLIEGHCSYIWSTKQILEQIGLESYFPVYY